MLRATNSILFAILALAVPVKAQEGATEVLLEKRVVVLSDLAVLPERIAKQHGSRAVLKSAKYANILELSAERRRQLVRRQLPALNIQLRHSGTVRFRFPKSEPRVSRQICYAARTSLDAGAFLYSGNVDRVSCRSETLVPPLQFDSFALTLKTKEHIAAGRYLGPVRVPAWRPVAANKTMQLVSRHGPVSVTRNVTTLQTAREGNRVFVRTEDGDVFSATLMKTRIASHEE